MHLRDVLFSPMANMEITLVNTEPPWSPVSRMDISALLNQPDESDKQSESMEVDSPPPTYYTPKNSSQNSPVICTSQFPSLQVSRLYPHRLPSMKEFHMPSADSRPTSNDRLPPLRSLINDVRLPPMNTTLEKNNHYSETLEIVMRDFQNRETRLPRRQSHHPSHFPRIGHHRIVRRRSQSQSLWNVPVYRTPGDHHRYQQPVILVDDQDTHYDSSSSPVLRSKKGSHNNKAYTKEMIMWMRYFAVDRDYKYNELLPLFWEQFPERWDPLTSPRATGQMISSRLYRDNDRPELDENNKWGFDDKGRLKMVKAKVRAQTTVEGKDLSFPYTLVEKWPARLLEYEWKMPILEEHKEMARRILRGDDPNDPQGKKAEWRRILNECEEYIYKVDN